MKSDYNSHRRIRGRLVSNLIADSMFDSYGHACSTDYMRLRVLVLAPSHQARPLHGGTTYELSEETDRDGGLNPVRNDSATHGSQACRIG